MRHSVVFSICVVLSSLLFLTGMTKEEFSKLTVEQKRQYINERTGGFVESKAKGRPIVLLDARKAPGKALTLVKSMNQLGSKGAGPGLPMRTLTEKLDALHPIRAAQKILRDMDGSLLVAIIDSNDDLMGLTVMPEERIAIVDAADYENDELRIIKEIWRSIGFIGGVGFSQFPADPMQPVYSLQQLDNFEGTVLLPLSLNGLSKFCKQFGISRAKRVPYSFAVREGWAPAPTNDLQKAVWTRLTADKERGPSKPLTIAPPAKK